MISSFIQKVQFYLEEERKKYIQKVRKYPLHIKLDSEFNFRKKINKLKQKYSSPCGNTHVYSAMQFWAKPLSPAEADLKHFAII